MSTERTIEVAGSDPDVDPVQASSRRWYQFGLRTLVLLMTVAGPALYCAFLFGPMLYDRMFPTEGQTLPQTYYLRADVEYDSSPVTKGTTAEAMQDAQTSVKENQ